jgi:hypothetical protein
MQWFIGKCAGCGAEIVRRYPYRIADGGSVTLTNVCYCSPKLECILRPANDDGVLVVWNEKKK